MIFKWAIAMVLSAPFALHAASKTFSLPTKDRYTYLNGQIDYPVMAGNQKVPAVVFVGGTGLFDRDYDYGGSGTEKDLLFKTLAQRLNENGIAAVRFDYRGISCSFKTVAPLAPTATADERVKNYVEHCIQNMVRGQVNPQNIREDIASVFAFAKADKNIDGKKIVIFGHSEGTIHTSFMIGAKKVQPKGVLFLGFAGESPRDLVHWQTVSRIETSYWAMDADKDGQITDAEVETFCAAGRLTAEYCQSLKSPAGLWTREALVPRIEKYYDDARIEALKHNDSELFKYLLADKGAIFASYGWWKMFFTETRPTYLQLVNFTGKISLNNGELDGATPAERNLTPVERDRALFKGELHINRYPNRGHSLADGPMVGPIPEESMQALLSEINWLMQ